MYSTIELDLVLASDSDVGDGQIELHVYDINADAEIQLLKGSCLGVGYSVRKDRRTVLGLVSDVRASPKIVVQDYGEACLMPVVTLERTGECEIQFQDYSVAIVVSMVFLEFQASGRRLDIEADGVVQVRLG
ncbi:Zinc Finger And Btb Domain-Containing Protein 6 [Manis pentadactyla]|nr:Zinc Finger And Btb Domain-Containing Protein 6 [Manis pentadactyla]